jgi:hypothetical protein
VEPAPDSNFLSSAQGGGGAVRVLTDNLGEERTVVDAKAAQSRQAEMSTETPWGGWQARWYQIVSMTRTQEGS